MAKKSKNEVVEQVADDLMGEETAVETAAATEAPAPKKPVEPARLCKGTMPSCLVWYIKFHEPKDNKSEIAKKYCTTPGKIADIQGNANQKYIVQGMVFTAAELDAAREQVKANFTRGQAENAAKPGSVNQRSLASTKPGDETYALEVIDVIAKHMAEGAEGVTLDNARSTYRAANPTAGKGVPKSAAPKGADDAEICEDGSLDEAEGDDSLDELLD